MKGDFSRQTFDPKKHYSAVLMQQGRVQVDADWNEQQAIHQHRIETETKDIIGLCGVPTNAEGFRIGVVKSLNGVFFVSEQKGWIVGDNGNILATADGGKTWKFQKSGVTENLFGVYFVNEQKGWAVGDNGIILASADSGENWTIQASRVQQPLQGVYFVNERKGWVLAGIGTILTTNNGGTNWRSRTSGVSQSLQGVYFVNDQKGWAVGDNSTILTTNNGGTNWTSRTSGVSQSLQGVYFVNDQKGWAVGDNGAILTTNNGGTNWTSRTSGVSQSLQGVYFVNDKGWVVGDDGIILATSDGGNNWEKQNPANNLTISPGRIYVDGILCENNEETFYTNQLDFPEATLPEKFGFYLVYLDVWQRHITEIDDSHIREVALGGPDTATRLKTIWQVKTLLLTSRDQASCDAQIEEWNKLTAPSQVTLNARTQTPSSEDNPCLIPPKSGYQRLENQLYRVEIHKGGSLNSGPPPTFKWSRDNGSVVTAIKAIREINPNVTEITVRDLGPDEILGFTSGQWVEVLDDRNELTGKPGQLVQIVTIDEDRRAIATTPKVDKLANIDDGVERKYHPKLRRWDQTGTSATPTGVQVTNNWLNLEGGIQVQFSEGTYKSGDYWLIPARTATGEIEWPPYQTSNTNPLPQPPTGIQHHYCRLAIVSYLRGKLEILEDCRKLFSPLTKVPSAAKAIHVVKTNWLNDGALPLEQFLNSGLEVTLDAPIVEQLLTPAPQSVVGYPTMIITLEAPLVFDGVAVNSTIPGSCLSYILNGSITVDNDSQSSSIRWRPINQLIETSREVIGRLFGQFAALRVRVVLKGHTIWSEQNNRSLYLDGQAFGRLNSQTQRTELNFPSGAGARASDFESWFYLTPPPLQITIVRFIDNESNLTVEITQPQLLPNVEFGESENVNTIEIAFNRIVRSEVSLAGTPQSLRVERLGVDRESVDRIRGNITVDSNIVRFVIAQEPSSFTAGSYRLIVSGSNDDPNFPAVRAEDNNAALDGDFNGQAGGNFILPFNPFIDIR